MNLRLKKIFQEIKNRGLLLQADSELPSVARMIIGGPFKGSWWGHAKGHEIYNVCGSISEHPDILSLKLISKKITYVHRDLWSAVFAVATSKEDWQRKGLTESGKNLFARLKKTNVLRSDTLDPASRKLISQLEARLLIHCGEVHTDSGAHAKALETWTHWAKAVGFKPKRIAIEQAKKMLLNAAVGLEKGTEVRARLPWD